MKKRVFSRAKAIKTDIKFRILLLSVFTLAALFSLTV